MKKSLLIISLLFYSFLVVLAQDKQSAKQEQRSYSIWFAWNKWAITSNSQRAELGKVIYELTGQPEAKIAIIGWADKTGSKSANHSMSLRRAESVRNYLMQNGISQERITVNGNGVDTKAENQDQARRADITLTLSTQQQNSELQYSIEQQQSRQQPSDQQQQNEPTKERPETEQTKQSQQQTAMVGNGLEVAEIFKKGPKTYTFALRLNALHWLMTTMNLGVEWRPLDSFSVVLDGDYAPWSWNNKLNRYNIWNIQPQVRFYMCQSKKLYVGGEFHAGSLNWKLTTEGHQGDFIGGGIVVGYQLRLNSALDLDFNLGGGYTGYTYDKYIDWEGFSMPTSSDLKYNYWGITSAGVTLVWKLVK